MRQGLPPLRRPDRPGPGGAAGGDQLAVEIVNEARTSRSCSSCRWPATDRPLLVTAFCFFFRQEVADRQELTNGMVLDVTERLYAVQSAGFEAMQELLAASTRRCTASSR